MKPLHLGCAPFLVVAFSALKDWLKRSSAHVSFGTPLYRMAFFDTRTRYMTLQNCVYDIHARPTQVHTTP